MYQSSGQGTYVPTMVPPPGYAAQMQTMSGGQQVAGVYDNSAMMGMQMNQQAAYMHPQQMMWGAQVAGNYLAGSTGAVAEAESDPDMYETCVYLGVEDVDGFNVRSRVIGEKGENLEYMRRNTQAKVLLRGKGSGVHNNKPLHIFISHHTLQGMQETEKLANNLVKVIKEEHADFLAKNADQVFKKSGSSSQRDSYSGSNSNRSFGNERSTSYQQPNIMQQQSMVYSNMRSNDASHGGNQVGGGMVFEYGHSRSSSDDRNQTRNQNQNQGFIQRGMQDTNDRNRNQNQGFNQRGMQDTNGRNRNQNQGFNQRGMQDTRGQSSFSSRSRFDSGGDNFERNRTTNHRDQSSRSSQLSRSSYLDDSSGSRSYNRDRGTSSYTAGRTTQSHYCDVCSIDCPTRQMYNQHCKGAMHKEKEEAMMKQLRSPPRGRSFSKDLEGTHWEGPPEPTSSRTERNRQKTESKRDHDTDKTLEDWVFQECEKRVKLMIGEGPLNHLKRMVEKIGQRDLKSALPTKAQSDDYCKLCKMDVTDMKQHLTVKSHGSLYLLRQIQLGELFMEYYSDVPIPGVITDGGRVLAMDTLSFGPCIPETNRRNVFVDFRSKAPSVTLDCKQERFKELLVYSGAYLAYTCSVCVTKIQSLGQWVHHITSKKHGKKCIELMLKVGSFNFRSQHMNIPIPPPKNALEMISEMEVSEIHPTIPKKRKAPPRTQGNTQTGNAYTQLAALSPSERQLVLQIQVLTGIGDLSVITNVLANLESMDSSLLQTLCSMDSSAVTAAMAGSGALQNMEVPVVQKIIRRYAQFRKGTTVVPQTFGNMRSSTTKKDRQQDRGRSRWDDGTKDRKSNDSRDRRDDRQRDRKDNRGDSKSDRGKSDSKNGGKSSDKPKDSSDRARQEKRKGDKAEDPKSKKSCPDKEKSPDASDKAIVIDLTEEATEKSEKAEDKEKGDKMDTTEEPPKTEPSDKEESKDEKENGEKNESENSEKVEKSAEDEKEEGDKEAAPVEDKEASTDDKNEAPIEDKDASAEDEKPAAEEEKTAAEDKETAAEDKKEIETEGEATKTEDKEVIEIDDDAPKEKDKEIVEIDSEKDASKSEDGEAEKVEVKDEPVKEEVKEEDVNSEETSKSETKEDVEIEGEKTEENETPVAEVKEDVKTEEKEVVKSDEEKEKDDKEPAEDEEMVEDDKNIEEEEPQVVESSDKDVTEAGEKETTEGDIKETADEVNNSMVTDSEQEGSESKTEEEKDTEVSAEELAPEKAKPSPRGRRGRKRGRGAATRGSPRGRASPRATRASLRSQKPDPAPAEEPISLDQFETIDEYVADDDTGEPAAKKACTEGEAGGDDAAKENVEQNTEQPEEKAPKEESEDVEMKEEELIGEDDKDEKEMAEMDEEALLGSEEEIQEDNPEGATA